MKKHPLWAFWVVLGQDFASQKPIVLPSDTMLARFNRKLAQEAEKGTLKLPKATVTARIIIETPPITPRGKKIAPNVTLEVTVKRSGRP